MAASAITRIPADRRTELLNKLSANANASAGAKRQTVGRPPSAAARNLRNALGIYLIEANRTGTLAYNVGGATPATITVEDGTPATTVIAANEQDPVVFGTAGVKSLSVTVGNTLAGNTKLNVT